MANRLSTERRAQIVGCLVEGMSIRGTVRVTGAAKNTVTKLLVDLGEACAEFQDGELANLGSGLVNRSTILLLTSDLGVVETTPV